jgi:hypothetical protein
MNSRRRVPILTPRHIERYGEARRALSLAGDVAKVRGENDDKAKPCWRSGGRGAMRCAVLALAMKRPL